MKKKHLIKTVDDIKYCEENNIVLTDLNNKKAFCIFDNNTWIWSDSKTSLYNVQLSLDGTLYYYEEQEQKEASEEDVGKLCWFFYEEDKGEKIISVLRKIEPYDYGIGVFMTSTKSYYPHCRPLTKEEIKEFMEKAE